ncbi:hypothetical protein [Litoribrevibacter albus]|uniref:Uncharacterized protein n=1 Tax=Litoribrevibacter albus TaxID=1473156 RepID=A0AA37W6Q7_9GAMM|nr:hypothetical protein [Litoribrevibacter albus]GLQ29756.1 hypothetical protein GCM10007876_02340 [Litoribrevibacter albus]
MSDQIQLCLSASSTTQTPCFPGDQPSAEKFKLDNPHISGPVIQKGTPYIIRPNTGAHQQPWQQMRPDLALMFKKIQSLSASERRNISEMNEYFGTDMLLALSEVYENEIQPLAQYTQNYMTNTVMPIAVNEFPGVSGAAATAMESRMSQFAKSALKYQKALEQVRAAHIAKVPKMELTKLEQKARLLHKEFNARFQAEINKYMGKAGKRGNVWTNAERGINQAKGARTSKPITLSSMNEFNLIRKFEKVANVGGKSMIILDAGLRVSNVYKDYQTGKDWQRTLVTESVGFGLGTAAGAYVGAHVATAAMGVFLAATPVGWVFVIGAGIVAGYAVAKGVDYGGKVVAGALYDRSSAMSWF